ncbi:MAG TPA: hypothetical protein VMZ27_09455, partial [Candidatus Saccharimonadales bacterium]|nr:hypothetical protein [Candidatus Saccharimonadales bacterium]
NMSKQLLKFWALACVLIFSQLDSMGWDYEGHRIVNQLALASLPKDFPAFVTTSEASERIAFLSGEPDRWRNTSDLPLKHFNGPDHYFDLEDLKFIGMDAQTLTHFRYDFVVQLAAGRGRYATNFPAIDPEVNADHTRELIGFLPWTITEYYGKLKSGFSYLKTLQEAGTPQEIANAEQNIIYIMGVMGHFVGDGGQPLHTTIHHNGWIGENPKHYATNKTIHSWVDGGYIAHATIRTAVLLPKLRPATVLPINEGRGSQTKIFPLVMEYLVAQHQQVEPLYKLDRDGKLSSKREIVPEAYDFISGQLLKSGQMLGSLWVTAWQHAPPDNYLRTQLMKRKALKKLGDSKSAE